MFTKVAIKREYLVSKAALGLGVVIDEVTDFELPPTVRVHVTCGSALKSVSRRGLLNSWPHSIGWSEQSTRVPRNEASRVVHPLALSLRKLNDGNPGSFDRDDVCPHIL